MNRAEIETYVLIKYGPPVATAEYISRLPESVFYGIQAIGWGTSYTLKMDEQTVHHLTRLIAEDRALIRQELVLQCIHNMLINHYTNLENEQDGT